MPNDSMLIAIHDMVVIIATPVYFIVLAIGLAGLIVWSIYKSREKK